jgi:hypothetical protein
MAVASVSFRYPGSIGSVKLEFILVDAPSSGDTVQTRLSNAKWVIATTAGVTGQITNASASVNATTKTITIGTSNGVDNIGLIVVGF